MADIPEIIAVDVQGEGKDFVYDTVFFTTTLGSLQKMDQTKAQQDHHQVLATVVDHRTDCGITKAGLGSMGRADSQVHAPSYNHQDGVDKPTVLLCG